MGDDAREVAGENTPTPESLSFENSDSSNADRSANPLLSSSATPLGSGEVALLSSVGDSERPGDEDEVSSMRMEGIVSLGAIGLSVVDALATSTTPSVRAMTYDDISNMPRTATGNTSRNARTRMVEEIFATHDAES